MIVVYSLMSASVSRLPIKYLLPSFWVAADASIFSTRSREEKRGPTFDS